MTWEDTDRATTPDPSWTPEEREQAGIQMRFDLPLLADSTFCCFAHGTEDEADWIDF